MAIVLVALVVGFVVIGGLVVGVAMLSSRGGSGPREGVPIPASPAAPAARTGPAPAVPAEWGWARLNDRGEKSLGYYYRDRTAGPSFHVLSEAADPPPTPESLRDKRYRGSLTKRLAAHETMQIPESAADLATMLRGRFDSGGASGCVVLKLTKAERDALGLPDAPPWIDVYLR